MVKITCECSLTESEQDAVDIYVSAVSDAIEAMSKSFDDEGQITLERIHDTVEYLIATIMPKKLIDDNEILKTFVIDGVDDDIVVQGYEILEVYPAKKKKEKGSK